MMNAIQQISDILDEHYPELVYNVKSGEELSIDKTSEDGFDLRVVETSRESTLFFNQWHCHFKHDSDDADTLFSLFVYALSKHGRLSAVLRGGREYQWTFETLTPDGEWVVFGTTGTPNLKFWLEKTVKVYQNDLIEI
jgi:hypothetical protein